MEEGRAGLMPYCQLSHIGVDRSTMTLLVQKIMVISILFF